MQPSLKIQKTNLKIGQFEICPLPTGIFGLDGGAMFGTVPKVLWEKSNPADSQNRIDMEARCLLLKSANLNILIDTGNGGDFIKKYGEKLGSKFGEMYNIKDPEPTIIKSLKRYNLNPEDIHVVILTHLHFDHAGGATTERGGELVPTFPKAKYFVQKQNLATAQKPNLREKASYFTANFQPLLDKNVLTLLDGPQENLFPGVSVLLSHGHTLGQQVVKVSDQHQTLLYCADLIPTASHVRLPWLMGYDLNPLLLMEEKNDLLSQAAEQGWQLYFEHDPYCDSATVEKKGTDYQVKERYHLG